MKRVGHSQAKAFTLVELLVVISIIALLIAILLPSLQRARIQAKNVKDGTQLHDIGIALMAYAVEFNRFPPQNSLGSVPTLSQREAPAFFTYTVQQTIASYMGGLQQSKDVTQVDANGQVQRTIANDVFYCPFVPPERVKQANGTNLADRLSGPGYPIGVPNAEEPYMHVSYAYFGALNEYGNDPALRTNVASGTPQSLKDEILFKRKNYAKKEPHAGKILMSDMVMYWGGGQPEWRINHGAGWGATKNASRARFGPPKLDGANELFGDAHVDWQSPAHFRELTDAPSGPFGWLQATQNSTFARGIDHYWW